MNDEQLHLPEQTVITGWDFSTGAVKCLAIDLHGNVLAQCRFPTDLWTQEGARELNLLQLEGQVRASTRAIAAALRELGRLDDWRAGGISATHHTAGRIDQLGNPIRRAICWNDQTLAPYHAAGLQRLGGPDIPRQLIGGPWAERFTLTHLIKDESTLSDEAHINTRWILPHAALAAGYLTGRFGHVSVSSAASTGLMDLRSDTWQPKMLAALQRAECQQWNLRALPAIVPGNQPIGALNPGLALETGLNRLPLIAPGLDDQAAALAGAGAVLPGHVAIVLGNSAVVNASSSQLPTTDRLDALKTNWSDFLWMRCYSNGAQFVDTVAGPNPDWTALETAARTLPPGCHGASVLPFALSEPCLGVHFPVTQWTGQNLEQPGVRIRAAFEALACLIAIGLQEHQQAGQTIQRITVTGGLARSDLLCEILASILNHPLERLAIDEGPALGAALAACWMLENNARRQSGNPSPFPLAAAARQLVRPRGFVEPNPAWIAPYQLVLSQFLQRIEQLASKPQTICSTGNCMGFR